jgi:hypothetical protein
VNGAGLRGLQVARQLALAGAETAVRTPTERLPFDEFDPPSGGEWAAIGAAMRDYEAGPDPLVIRLREDHGLSWLDTWLVLLCAAVERYPEAAAAIGLVMDEAQAHLVTPMAFARLMASACATPIAEGLSASLAGGRALRRDLIEARDLESRPHTHHPIRLAAHELSRLVASAAGDPLPAPSRPFSAPPVFDAALVRIGAELLGRSGVLCLRGPSPRAVRQFASDLAAALHAIPAVVPGGEPRDLSVALRLRHELPIIDLTESGVTPAWRPALADARTLVERLVVLARDSSPDLGVTSLNVPRLGWIEAERAWRSTTRDAQMAARLATKFRVSAVEAHAACRFADDVLAAVPDGQRTREHAIASHLLEDGARRMGRLVSHIRSEAALPDLVIPDHLREQLLDILDWQRHSPRVFGEMEIGRRSPLGRGLTCLFSGSPGTGKTFAAQCVANELGLNLYRIDLSQVVSKYIGDTEKALATVFDEAEAGHGVLLFDEADALFGKRSEVKDAHDRYANIEVGFLLQRLETFDGVAILATNLRGNLDPAFVRRMRFVLDFAMPDAAMRRQLWEQSLPATRFRGDDVDLSIFVDRFRLSGGSIQNISLAAAHMAAATPDGRVQPAHLVRATYRELEKNGQTRDRASFGALAEFLPREVA